MNTAGGQVVRRRLLGQLAERFRRRVVVVEAGAGFGKTTLLRQALAEATAHGLGLDVMVTVPRRGFDADALVHAVADALRRQGAHLGGRADVSGLLDAVWGLAPAQCCVVIDDAHWLTPDAGDVVVGLVDTLPTNGHLVVALRSARASVAPRLVVPDLLRLDERDLAFDGDEQLAFARVHGGTGEPDRFSGWPAMLELELRAGRSGAIEYLIDEVLAGLAPEQLDACRRLAVLWAVDDEMASMLLDRATTVAAETAGLPLVTTHDDGRVEMHALLRDALTAGWSPVERAAAQRRAADVAAALGHDDVAVTLYRRAGDIDAVRSIARRIAGDLHLPGTREHRRSTAQLLGDALGDSVETDVVAAVGRMLDAPYEAQSELPRALDRAVRAGDRELEAVCRLRLADLAYNAADPGALTAELERIDELATAGVHQARRAAFLPHVWLCSITNRHGEVDGLLDRFCAEHPDLDPDMSQLVELYRVLNLAYSGHVRAALAAAERLEQLPSGLFANRLGGFRMIQTWMLGRLGAQDRREAERLVDLIHDAGQVHLFVEGAATTALFHASAGDAGSAAQLVARAEEELHRLPAGGWARHTVAQAHAVLELLAGDESAAARRLADAVPPRGIASLPRFIYGATAALSYVLVPATRATWDADRGGPDHDLRLAVGRALVALREQAWPQPAADLPWDDVAALRTWAYEPHLAELAIAAAEGGNPLAERAIDDLRLDPRSVVDGLARQGPPIVRARAERLVAAMPRRPADVVEIRVLGALEVRHGGRPVADESWVRRQRVRDLLALLVDRRRIDRTRLGELLWPDKAPGAAASNLRFTLSQLQTVLEPRRDGERPWFVRSEGADLVLTGGELLLVDVDEFEQHLRAADAAERSGRPGRALDEYVRACERYGGDYLTGASDPEWGFYRGLQLRGRFVDAATRAAQLLLGVGDLVRAETFAVRAAQTEAGHEAAHRTLADVLLAQHRPGAAREVLGPLLAELDGLGLTAEPTTVALARRLGVDAGT